MEKVGHDGVEGDDAMRPPERFAAPQSLDATTQVVGRGAGEADGDDGAGVVAVFGCEPVDAEPLGGHGGLTGAGAGFDEDVLGAGGRGVPLLRGQGVDRAGVCEGPGHSRSRSFSSLDRGGLSASWACAARCRCRGPRQGPALRHRPPRSRKAKAGSGRRTGTRRCSRTVGTCTSMLPAYRASRSRPASASANSPFFEAPGASLDRHAVFLVLTAEDVTDGLRGDLTGHVEADVGERAADVVVVVLSQLRLEGRVAVLDKQDVRVVVGGPRRLVGCLGRSPCRCRGGRRRGRPARGRGWRGGAPPTARP